MMYKFFATLAIISAITALLLPAFYICTCLFCPETKMGDWAHHHCLGVWMAAVAAYIIFGIIALRRRMRLVIRPYK